MTREQDDPDNVVDMEEKLSSIYVVPKNTFFKWGFGFRSINDKNASKNNEYVKFFDLLGNGGQTKKIKLVIEGKEYPARIRIIRQDNQHSVRDVLSIFWNASGEQVTRKVLRKMFIYSYAATIRKKTPDIKELAEFIHLGGNKFRVKAEGRQKTEFDDMFQEMEDRGLFEFWKEKNDDKEKLKILLNKSEMPIWRDVKEFNKYKNRPNVIYLIHHSEKKQFYVGKANILGKRVKPGKAHQDVDEGWDRFMFFELEPVFAAKVTLEEIEDFAIRLFSSVLENNYKIKPIKWRSKLQNKAPLRKK